MRLILHSFRSVPLLWTSTGRLFSSAHQATRNAVPRIVLLVLQLCYVWHLFVAGEDLIVATFNVGSHFNLNNALQFIFIMLWVRSHFWIAEFVLVINLLNLKALYLRYSMTPSFIHIPVVSAPLAWTFIALLWNGAIMVDSHTFAAKILAHLVIWLILPFGLFYLGNFGDYTLGLELTVLSAGEFGP